MNISNISAEFQENAQPLPVIEPMEYFLLLKKLINEGKEYGKTEPVAAYLFRSFHLINSDSKDLETIQVEPVYLIMDLNEWPNEYGRSLMIHDIWAQYVSKTLEEQEINAPCFEWPGMWTAKQSSFEEDYTRNEELNEKGKKVNIYTPNPEAFRLCLNIETKMTIPVTWGTYPIDKGGTLAIRSKDIEQLTQSLTAVENKETSIKEALYEEVEGKTVSKFDVYGMDPGFLEKNYNPTLLQPNIIQNINRFRARNKNTLSS